MSSKKSQNKKEPRKTARTLKYNRISLSGDQEENIIYGRVSALELPLLVDTGAQISVISTESVPAAAKTDETVKVRGYSGTADASN